MLFLVIEGLLSRGLHLCTRRSVLKQSGFTFKNCNKEVSFQSQRLTHNLNTRVTCVGRHASRARFFCKDESSDLEEENKGDLSPPMASVVQTYERESGQRQRFSQFSSVLQGCGSPSDVLDLSSKYDLTPRQISNCLTHMWSTTKKMSEEQKRYELQLMFDHPAFNKLLHSSLNTAGHMRTEDIAYVLLSMLNLGIPQKSRVVQTLLRHCQEKLNDFDEKGLSILASSLAHMKEDGNVAALKEGMRMLIEMHLPEIKSVLALQTMMRVLGKDSPLHLKRKLERKALSMTDQFSLPNTQHMISTMATMGFYSRPLLDACSKKIRDNLHGIPFNKLLTVLLSCKELHYRDLDLLTATSDYIVSVIDIWTNKQLILFLSAFESLTFCPDALMETYAQKIIDDPDALTLKDILCVLRVYSSLNYDLKQQRQLFLDGLTQALCSYLPKLSTIALLRSVYYLSVLGCFPSAPLQQLMNEDTINQLKSTDPRYSQNQERMLRTVELCLRLESPALPVALPLHSFPLGDTASSSQPSAKPWLSQSLRSLLEEQENAVLQEMQLVENLYLIDAVITKHSPSQSSAHEASAVAELSPTSSQRIALISVANPCCYGTSKLRGLYAVMTRHLTILGYDLVLITDQELPLMSEQDRLDFLRSRIFPETRRPDESLAE